VKEYDTHVWNRVPARAGKQRAIRRPARKVTAGVGAKRRSRVSKAMASGACAHQRTVKAITFIVRVGVDFRMTVSSRVSLERSSAATSATHCFGFCLPTLKNEMSAHARAGSGSRLE
jgi:hypothetical protein